MRSPCYSSRSYANPIHPCTPGWSISKLKVFLCAFHRILPCLRATLSFSTLIGQGSPAMAVAKPGCGQMGRLTPLNCKPSEHSVGEAFHKDRWAVRFSSNEQCGSAVIMDHLFCAALCACKGMPRGAWVEMALKSVPRERDRVIKYQQVVSCLISAVSV